MTGDLRNLPGNRVSDLFESLANSGWTPNGPFELYRADVAAWEHLPVPVWMEIGEGSARLAVAIGLDGDSAVLHVQEVFKKYPPEWATFLGPNGIVYASYVEAMDWNFPMENMLNSAALALARNVPAGILTEPIQTGGLSPFEHN